jgi:hypothetical protein
MNSTIPENVKNLLLKVYVQTRNNKLKWDQTAAPEVYSASIGDKYIVSIADLGYSEGEKNYRLSLIDGDNQILLKLTSEENGNNIIHSKTIIPSNPLEQLMGIPKIEHLTISAAFIEIFENARKKALRIPEKINDAIRLIDKADINIKTDTEDKNKDTAT